MLCSVCRAVEHRLVFSHSKASRPQEPVSVSTTRHTLASPAEAVSAPRLELASPNQTPPTSSRATEVSSVPIVLPTSVLSEGENDLDECEALLRRAIEMVRGPTRSSQSTTSVICRTSATKDDEGIRDDACTERLPAPGRLPVLQEPVHVDVGDTTDTPEPLAIPLLNSCFQPKHMPTEATSGPELAGSVRAEGSSKSRVIVQIHYDPHKAKYAARDAKSGLSVLRHPDRARLRAMCDRMGWQVVEVYL
jgi:hypothetical protein